MAAAGPSKGSVFGREGSSPSLCTFLPSIVTNRLSKIADAGGRTQKPSTTPVEPTGLWEESFIGGVA